MKEKFLTTLENYLSPLSSEERQEILAFYEERFESGMRYEGKTAANIVAELESPETIARNVLREYGYHGVTFNRSTDSLRPWPIIGVLAFDLFVAIWLIPALFGIVVGFAGAFIGLVVGALGSLFIDGLVQSVWQTLFLLGFSYLWLMLVIWLYDVGIGFINWLVKIHLQAFNIGSPGRLEQSFKQLQTDYWLKRQPTLRRARNVLTLIAVAFIMVGGVMSVSTVGLGAFNFSEPLIEHIEHQDVSSDIDEGQGWTISSELELGDIQIVRISGQEIIMTSLEVERAPVTITIDSETRHIHFENRFSGRISGFNFLFFGFIERAGVVIEIPEDLIVSNIDLEATTGRVDIRGFTVEQINLTVLTGSLTLTDVHVNGLLFARTTTGSITVQNSQAEQFDLKTTTGTINVQRSTFDEATLKVTTGSIKLTTINTSAAPGTRLDAVSTTGSVRLENVYLMRLDLTTTTGSIHYDNADKSFQPERILARATTGSVNVTVQERP